ncbi:methenyltetrahydromethanopterin cyclohydrolase [Aeoliella sp. ICT_H6.2]|uniref:Methenyltetrahydromethanopterin cyclohydrolase n=1 Tax=Aeoliella straminimaris TaxID=2954799 RepID=A0A9X2JFU7_9BACT|nr:methenyltetrahydromethanopterin cyclohydrolase [Aeoliella straminimaris]MCO6042778.1 methenyltetrahydromethanopterin cyclohydrolase [Aeoliella straminimaris]
MLNRRAQAHCESIVDRAAELRVEVTQVGPTRVIDLGINAVGGLEAGRRMAEVSMAALGDVSLAVSPLTGGPAVMVRTDAPLAACMASQYAGWEVKGEGYFAMGSGPMRAAAAREELFDHIGFCETADVAVGLLETDTMPPEAVCTDIAAKSGVDSGSLTLLVAPTNSQAGNVQVVARSIETTLHKLHELGFDLSRIDSGWGIAPLPPVAGDVLSGIGRTNDAILYGGHVVLFVRGDQESIDQLGPRTPSSASSDHGRPFRELFAAYDHDFYKIDKRLFSPAVVELVNIDTGANRRYGEFAPDVLDKSFGR